MSVRVIQWGIGAMGAGITRLLLERKGVEIVGAVSHQDGSDLGEAVGVGKLGVVIQADPDQVVGKVRADVLLLSTYSFVKDVFPQVMKSVDAGLNVITTAEEMIYPWRRHREQAEQMDKAAKEAGVTILGTGINPGFVLDSLILMLTGACHRVDRIWASRVNDLSPFGSTVMRWQGVGFTPEEYQRGLKEGWIVGHVGFAESIMMIADAIGWTIDEIREEKVPIVSSVYRETPYVKVYPGMTAGSRQVGYGLRGGEVVITLEHPQQVRPELEGVEVEDRIIIEGVPRIDLTIRPEIAGGLGTEALVVNMIPHVLQAPPGLVTMKDLPLPYAWTELRLNAGRVRSSS